MGKFMIAALALVAIAASIEASPLLGGSLLGGGNLLGNSGLGLPLLDNIVASIQAAITTVTQSHATRLTPIVTQAAINGATRAALDAKARGATREVALLEAQIGAQAEVSRAVQSGVEGIGNEAASRAVEQIYL